jgi:hypothetical protein
MSGLASSGDATRVKTYCLRDRDAGHFGHWLGARSDVIYPVMSDEQRRQRPKGARHSGLLAEIESFEPGFTNAQLSRF